MYVMTRLLALCCLITLSAGAFAGAGCKNLKASGNPEYPPYLWRVDQDSNKMQGAIVLLMEYVSRQLDIEVDVHYVGPWGRVQEELAEGNLDMITGAFYTQERSYRMDYVRPPFQRTRTSVWVEKNNRFPYTSWQDLQSKSGVTVINNSFGQEFDEYAQRHLKIHQAVRLKQGLKMLLGNRVDYFLYEENPARAYASELGLLDQIVPLDHAVSTEDLFLTVSKMSPCNTPELRRRLASVMAQVKEDGMMETFLRQGMQQWQQRQ